MVRSEVRDRRVPLHLTRRCGHLDEAVDRRFARYGRESELAQETFWERGQGTDALVIVPAQHVR